MEGPFHNSTNYMDYIYSWLKENKLDPSITYLNYSEAPYFTELIFKITSMWMWNPQSVIGSTLTLDTLYRKQFQNSSNF